MILLDSDVIIDFLKGDEPGFGYVRRLAAEGADLATTSMNVTEVLRGTITGSSDAAHKAALDVLNGLREMPFGPRAARRCARLLAEQDRQGRPLPVLDAMIASVALEENVVLVTRNIKHFHAVEGLSIKAP